MSIKNYEAIHKINIEKFLNYFLKVIFKVMEITSFCYKISSKVVKQMENIYLFKI